MWVCCFTSASAAEYTSSSYLCYFETGEIMESEGNKVNIIFNTHKGNHISITTCEENGTKTYKNITYKEKRTYVLNKIGSLIYAYKCTENDKRIIVMNEKGKIKATYPIEFKLNKKIKKEVDVPIVSIEDLTKKGNKIYYLVSILRKKDDPVVYLQSYNIKSKKTTKYKRVKYGAWFFANNKLYLYTTHGTIEQYTLRGRKVYSYAIPEGEKSIIIHYPPSGYEEEVFFCSFDVVGRYIYYCDRNGVYRCDTEGNKTFELIYSGANDPVFNPKYVEELGSIYFSALENGNFHLFLGDTEAVYKDVIYRAKE